MPIASGAAGRVDVGVETSTTWMPDGLKRTTKAVNRNCDSYLQRYQEQMKKNRISLNQGEEDGTGLTDEGKGGTKAEVPGENTSCEDATSEKTSPGNKPRKSSLCVLL